jgi:threonine dehydratase
MDGSKSRILWYSPHKITHESYIMITLDAIQTAQARLNNYLTPTLLEPALFGQNIYLKLENTNRTHSFKIRGALNAVLSLTDAERQRGIVAASSGNHAQGVAYAAQLAGISARIYMPANTPERKVSAVRRMGAEARLDMPNYDQCEAEALRVAREDGLTYVSPYNDARIVAGAGTIGLEICEALPDVERVIVPISGGGLISGVACAVKSLKPDVKVIGVNALSAPTMYNLLYGTEHPENWHTLAEALSGDVESGSITIDLTKQYVDRIVLVDEEQISSAMRWMLDVQGWLVEGGGAVGVAAMLHGLIPADGRSTVIVVSGGNVDGTTLRGILG